MDSARTFVHRGAQEGPRVRLGDSCGQSSPTLGMAAGVSATTARGAALAGAPVPIDGCGRMKTRKQRDAREVHRRSGILTVPGELHAEHVEGGCTVPGTTVQYGYCRDALLLATQMLLCRQADTGGEQPALTVEETRLLTQRGRLDLRGEGYGKQSNSRVSGTVSKAGVLEGERSVAADKIHARTDSAGGNSRRSSSSAACVLDPSTEIFRRKAQAVMNSVCIALQRCDNCSGVCESDLTDNCSSHYGDLDGDTSSASACSTTAPVDPATRFLRSLCTARAPAHGYLPVGSNEEFRFVGQGVRAFHPDSSTCEDSRASSYVALGKPLAENMRSESPSSSGLHTATLQSVSFPRGKCGGLPTSNIGDIPKRNAAAIPCGEGPVVLLLKRINATAPSISTLTNSLAVPRVDGLYSCTDGEGASSPPSQVTIERDLVRRRKTLQANAEYPVHGETRALGRGGGATAVGIQTLPTGKRLADYYLIGPILDVCAQPQQLHEPDSGRRLPLKRLHSPQTKLREAARKRMLSRKVCRRKSVQRSPPEATTITSSGASCSRNMEKAASQELTESRYKGGAQTVEGKLNCPRADTLLSPGVVAESEDRLATLTEKVAEGGGEVSRPSPSCGRNVNPDKDVEDEAPPVDREPSELKGQTHNTAYNSGRPILRFAVARNLRVGTQRNPVKIIKSIEKRRIPASAGGDRLWRRLCERLLNLPPHPNVLSVEAVFEDSTFYHFVFERLEGGELFAFLLRQKVIEEPVCQYIIYQILMALHHLHSHNLLHRDIKPENLVFRRRRHTTAEPFLPQSCSPACSRGSLPSPSPTVLASSSSKRCNSSSPTRLYSETAGDHSLTNTQSFCSTSSSSSSSGCTAGRSNLDNVCCSRGGSASPIIAQPNSSHSSASTVTAQTPGIPYLPSNSSNGSRRRKKGTDAKEAAHVSLPHPTSAGEETVEDQYGQACRGRRAGKTTLQTIRDYELVLIDFDTCKMMEVPSEEYGEVVAGRRRLVGTYGYLAPEVLCGHVYSTQSDLWSVGIILYILMTGIPPLPMEDMVSACSSLNVFLEMHEKHGGILFDIPPLSDSPLAQDLCQRLLRLSRKERLSSAWVALSHPWFDNLNRDRPREDPRSMIPADPYGASPAADQRIPSCEYRERMTFDGFYRCPVPRSQAASPLKVSPLYEPLKSPASCAPGHTPLAFPSSPPAALTRPYAAADPFARGCPHIHVPKNGEQEQDDDQLSTAVCNRECKGNQQLLLQLTAVFTVVEHGGRDLVSAMQALPAHFQPPLELDFLNPTFGHN